MRTIWKYPLERMQFSEIEVPALSDGELGYINDFSYQVLHVEMQHRNPTIWAICDDDAPKRKVKIRMVGTGWNCDDFDRLKHIGTVIDDAGFVWHFFCE